MKRPITFLLALTTLFGICAMAQVEPPPGSRGFERVERWKKVRMVEALDLSEEQAVRLFARINEGDKQRREIMRERGEILDRIERLLSAAGDSLQFERAFSDLRAVERKMMESRMGLAAGLKGILSIQQQARFFLFERRFERELRDAMRDVQRRRHRMEAP